MSWAIEEWGSSVLIVPTALYGAEAWGTRSAERRKVNVLEMKCLRSLVGVSRMDRVRIKEMRIRVGIERELTCRVDQRVLRWFAHMERMDEYRMAWRVWMAEVNCGYGAGCTKMNERCAAVLNPCACVDDWVSRGHFSLVPVFFQTVLPRSSGLSPGEGWDAVTWCSGGKL